MERLCYVFTLSLSVLCSSQPASGQGGVFIEYDGVVLPNFDVGSHIDVGTSVNSSSVGTNIVCRTDNTDCCGGVFDVIQGSWYHPSGARVSLNTESLPSGQIYRQQGGDQVIRLRRVLGQSITTAANGFYRCEVPDQNGVIQTRYVGLYTETTAMPNGVGVVSISQAPQFSLISVDPLEFTLTSTTTGGPPANTFWTLPPDSELVSPGDTFSQRLIDAVAATVEHTLTVTERVTGTYTFFTTNVRSGAPDSRTIVIGAANPPSGLIAVQSGLTSVNVSWTAPAPGGATRTGYRIFYETGGSEQSVDVGAGATSCTLTGLHSGATYSISIVALSGTLPSTVLGPFEVVVVLMAPTVPTQELNSTSITITFTQPSGATAERYDIQYTRVTGDGQTLCGSVGDTGSDTDVQSPYNITDLEEFSTYSITVTARVGSAMQSTTTQVTTSPAAPSTAPRDLMNTTVRSTSITVEWNPVECIERNGVIDSYIVWFGPEDGAQSERTVQSDGIDQPGTYTASGLTPSTDYTFEVAAMNSAGRGPFTTPLIVETGESGADGTNMPTNTKMPSGTDTSSGSNMPADVPNNTAGAVAGAVIAFLVIVAIIIAVIIVVIVVLRRHRTRSDKKSSDSPPRYEYHIPLSASAPPSEPPPDVPLTATTDFSTQYINVPGYPERVLTEPSIKEFPDETHVTEGESVFFKVKVSGHPKPTLSWYHDGAEVQADYSTEQKEDGSLAINSSELRHAGVYQMVAKNEAGSTEREVTLYVNVEGGPTPAVQKKTVVLQPIPVAEFGEHVARGHANNSQPFRDQFTALDSGEGHAKSIGLSPANKKLNRFANIAAYDENRIILKPIEDYEECQREYINACYIDGYSHKKKFIATQGPLPKTLVDFWRLVWQEKVCTIVMVTNLKEGSKAKCQQYWPDTSTKSFGPFDVTITDSQLFADYTVRSFKVALAGSSSRSLKVTQYHFTAWPDHGVPDYATPILAYHRRAISQHRPSRGPMLVHCSAGIGRTGTFICIDMVLEQIKAEKLVDISGTINQLRHQRMKMVQTPEQFVFINDAILESVTCGDTQISATNLRSTIQRMSRIDPKTHKTTFESQFHVLDQVSPKPNEVNCATALEYPDRNRSKEYLPADRYRVLLRGEHPDYIHASFVHGYKQQKTFIVTQGPMKSTCRDFWKMVYDKKCGAIVALSELRENGKESTYQYWPTSGMLELGGYTVDLLEDERLQGFTIRTLSVLDNKSGKAHQVTQFHIHNWTPDGKCSSFKSVVDAIDEVSKVQRRTGNHPVVVHCSDTVSRSGMFCAIATTIERCKTEGVVDVFQVVKALRVQKPGSVLTVEQYQAVFEAVLVFLDSFDTYANFQNV